MQPKQQNTKLWIAALTTWRGGMPIRTTKYEVCRQRTNQAKYIRNQQNSVPNCPSTAPWQATELVLTGQVPPAVDCSEKQRPAMYEVVCYASIFGRATREEEEGEDEEEEEVDDDDDDDNDDLIIWPCTVYRAGYPYFFLVPSNYYLHYFRSAVVKTSNGTVQCLSFSNSPRSRLELLDL
jgi:hypothetical protein